MKRAASREGSTVTSTARAEERIDKVKESLVSMVNMLIGVVEELESDLMDISGKARFCRDLKKMEVDGMR